MPAKRKPTAVLWKVEGQHKKGCRALLHARTGWWDSPWSSYPKEWEWRDTIGRKHRYARQVWLVFRCNIPDCNEIKLLVNLRALLKKAPRTWHTKGT